MSDSFYQIRCWLENRRGQSFSVVLIQSDDEFSGMRQDEVDSSIPSIRDFGRIDFNYPHEKFTANRTLVLGYLAELERYPVPIVPREITFGFDGVHHHVQIENGYSASRFSWWQESPTPWHPLETFWGQIVALSQSEPSQ